MTDFIKTFEYDIVNGVNGEAIDGCAKFYYKGLEVSFSTQGRSQGACPQEVIVFKKNAKTMHDELARFTRVHDAIKFIDDRINDIADKLFISGLNTGGTIKGVLTNEEAYLRGEKFGTVICISNMKKKTFFFSDNHCFGHPVLGSDYVPSTCSFPLQVVAREGLEDGVVDTIEKFIAVFEKDSRQIETIEELASEII